MTVPTRLAIVVVAAAACVNTQPAPTGKDPRKEILERALHSDRGPLSEVPLSLALSFFPSAHAESKIVIRFKSGTRAEVELIQPSVASWIALQKARGNGSVDIAAAMALMEVRRKRLPLDPKTASAWLGNFIMTFRASLDSISKQSLDGQAQVDGTLYMMSYVGNAEISITVPGCELGSDCTRDIPLVRWMNDVHGKVVSMMGIK